MPYEFCYPSCVVIKVILCFQNYIFSLRINPYILLHRNLNRTKSKKTSDVTSILRTEVIDDVSLGRNELGPPLCALVSFDVLLFSLLTLVSVVQPRALHVCVVPALVRSPRVHDRISCQKLTFA